jgi:peptidoglycan/xylan/chitin deacetylase (PgdA/CDA1 family)
MNDAPTNYSAEPEDDTELDVMQSSRSMLKVLKQTSLSLVKAAGGFTLTHRSGWRRKRLLILAYHGVSIDDEHRWNPSLFMHSDYFAARLQLIKNLGCTVLPLGVALRRMYAGDLPHRSVALTFDDGGYEFYRVAYPLIKEFDLPVTLYLTTYYSHYNRPVFHVMCPYLLWKGRQRVLALANLTGGDETFTLSNERARAAALRALLIFARAHDLTAEEKDDLNERLARQLHVDYERLLEQRILHLVSPAEARQLAAEGVDVQLHTHRHRTPAERSRFVREIEDNRRSIREITGSDSSLTHFCYPNGFHGPAFFPWLKEMGIESAATCDAALASRSSNPLLLPRLVDSSLLSPVEFESWVTGVADFLPQRARA